MVTVKCYTICENIFTAKIIHKQNYNDFMYIIGYFHNVVSRMLVVYVSMEDLLLVEHTHFRKECPREMVEFTLKFRKECAWAKVEFTLKFRKECARVKVQFTLKCTLKLVTIYLKPHSKRI